MRYLSTMSKMSCYCIWRYLKVIKMAEIPIKTIVQILCLLGIALITLYGLWIIREEG